MKIEEPSPFNGLPSLVVIILCCTFTAAYHDDDRALVFTYSRADEIENHCGTFLSSASVLGSEHGRDERLETELSFKYGDWEQGSNGSPWIPFDDPVARELNLPHTEPLRLVSFEVKDVSEDVIQVENSISIGGILSIGITAVGGFSYNLSERLVARPGLSVLTILFEGIYVENGGEILLCLLGRSALPSRQEFESSESQQALVSESNEILLVLKYPRVVNLANREIIGEMRSWSERGSASYFDAIRISSSRLGRDSEYRFSHDVLTARACSPHPSEMEMVENDAQRFNGSEFCKNLELLSFQAFTIDPDWNFDVKDTDLAKLGPFQVGREVNGEASLVISHIRCEHDEKDLETSKVFAVLRIFQTSTGLHIQKTRTGLSGTTMAAEGTFDASTGYLCMVGCLGGGGSGLEPCDSTISLHFPRKFSLTQRSVTLRSNIFDQYDYTYSSYDYSQMDLAFAARERSQTSKFGVLFSRYFHKYPGLVSKEIPDLVTSLNDVADSLQLDLVTLPSPFRSGEEANLIFVSLEVLSLGPFLGNAKTWYIDSIKPISKGAEDTVTNHQLLNVSLHLTFPDAPVRNISSLFLEGLYDSVVGEMYLTGCREVTSKGGLDCSIEAKIQYPLETTRWLKNPVVEISISSLRKEEDALYFQPISLHNLRIQHIWNLFEDVISRKAFEDTMRIMILLLTIFQVLWQLRHVKRNQAAAPYVSLVMLTLQMCEFSFHLAQTEAEFLLKSNDFALGTNVYNYLRHYQPAHQAANAVCRGLLYGALLVTAWLFKRVLESRNRLSSSNTVLLTEDSYFLRSSNATFRSEMTVLAITLAVNLLTVALLGIIHYILGVSPFLISPAACALLACDLFLVPQIVMNFSWLRGDNSASDDQPLCKGYYIRMTGMRVAACLYDYVRDPFPGPYGRAYELQAMKADYHSRNESVVLAIVLIGLAAVVRVQETYGRRKSKRL
uniref:RING-type E3 ubiquitin transferase n=1 Tax=Kalanchoe fedtschenkoi TaxID=63787 RepID=A0A7N0TGC0_KALFE